MNIISWKIIAMLIISIAISIVLTQDHTIRYLQNDNIKHAVPIASCKTFLGDENHYYVLANDSLSNGIIKRHNVYSTNNVLIGALILTSLINKISGYLTPSSDLTVLLSLIIQTSLLVFSVLFSLKTLIEDDGIKISLAWLAFITLLSLIFADFFLINSYLGGITKLPLLSYYPNILRIVNPQMGWTMGLTYFSLHLLYLKKKSIFNFSCLALLSLALGTFSPSLCMTMLLAVVFMTGYYCFKDKYICIDYLFFTILLSISFIYSYIQIKYFQQSPKGLEINTGLIHGLAIKLHYGVLLLLCIPVTQFFKNRQSGFLVSVIIASIFIAIFSESVHLGERLWIRGSGIYIWIICVAIFCKWWIRNETSTEIHSHTRTNLYSNKYLPLILFAVGIIYVLFLLPKTFNSHYGFIDSKKWKLIDWINHHTPEKSIIISDDLEFSFLLPIYTKSEPFVPLFSYSSLSTKEIAQRYFFAIDLFKKKERVLNMLQNFNLKKYQLYLNKIRSDTLLSEEEFTQLSFFNYIIYYPFTKFSKPIFDSKLNHDAFFKTLLNWDLEASNNKFYVDYIIIDNKSENFKCGKDMNIVFSTIDYSLCAVSNTSSLKLHGHK